MTERWEHELRTLAGVRPAADLWERALGGSRLPDPAPHPLRSRLLPAAIVLLILVGAGVVTWRAFSSIHPGPADEPLVTYADPRFGWTLRVPRGLLVREFTSGGFFESSGLMVSNFPTTPHGGNGTPDMSGLRDFPATGVAVQIWFGQRLPVPPPPGNDPLPLDPRSFREIRPYVGGREPTPLYVTFAEDGFYFSAAMWFGPDASVEDRMAIETVLRSLEFPQLREGTIWQNRYYVLGPADRYAVGSVTRIDASSLPQDRESFSEPPESFFLLHAPGGFYVVRGVDSSSGSDCQVRFDVTAFEFECPAPGQRWDREGRAIGRVDSERFDLGPHAALVALDGHVLYGPSSVSRSAERRIHGGRAPIRPRPEPAA